MPVRQKKPGTVALERAISKLGIASRSQSRAWILAGRISVNGVIRRNPQFPVIPEEAVLELDGASLRRGAPKTILLHKPRGVLTTRSDEKGRPTVYSLLSAQDQQLHAVGRLDMASSGLLLMTNDTRLSSWLTDPQNRVPRTYVVTVRGRVAAESVERLRAGIHEGGERLCAEDAVLLKSSGKESLLRVVLTEGKNREIRRMLSSIGHEVTRLKRIAFGGLALGTLPPGRYREVPAQELEAVFPQAPRSRIAPKRE